MKRLLATILAMVIAVSLALTASAEADYTDYVCKEEKFSVKVPSGAAVVFEEGNGLTIYTAKEGVIPYAIIHRRAMEKKFSNPENFLNNVYREHLEDKYGDSFLGMNPAKIWEVGGKELIGARYMYKVEDTTVVLVKLLDIRDAGDVEYTIKYVDGKEDTVMPAVEEAVRSYSETDVSAGNDVTGSDPTKDGGSSVEAAPPAVTEPPAAVETGAADVLRPLDLEGMTVDTDEGRYMACVKDLEKILDGGWFTLDIYMADTYAVEGFNNLRENSKIEVAGRVLTVDQIKSLGDGSCELYTREDVDGYIVFKKDTDTTCSVTLNDWTPCRFLESVKIMMPLANNFSFVWAGGDESAQVYDADAFVDLAASGKLTGELRQYNTLVQFNEGLLEMIGHTDYPYGPDDDWEASWVEQAIAPAAGTTETGITETGTTETGGYAAYGVPSFLTPSVFTSRFNATMEALADKFADTLGDDGVSTVKSDYTFTEYDPQGNTVYYGTKGWGIEAGFFYLDPDAASDDSPALLVNLNIKNDVPEIPAFFAAYTFQMMIGYDYKDTIDADALANWFDNASDISDVFSLPGYSLSIIPGDEYTQYAFLPASNPLIDTAGE